MQTVDRMLQPPTSTAITRDRFRVLSLFMLQEYLTDQALPRRFYAF